MANWIFPFLPGHGNILTDKWLDAIIRRWLQIHGTRQSFPSPKLVPAFCKITIPGPRYMYGPIRIGLIDKEIEGNEILTSQSIELIVTQLASPLPFSVGGNKRNDLRHSQPARQRHLGCLWLMYVSLDGWLKDSRHLLIGWSFRYDIGIPVMSDVNGHVQATCTSWCIHKSDLTL